MSEKPCLANLEFSQTSASVANGGQIDTGFLDVSTADKYQLSWIASASGLTLETQSKSREDDSAVSSSFTYTASSFFVGSLPVRQRFMRFILKNNTGGAVTDVNLEVKTTFGSSDKANTTPLAVAVSDSTPAVLTKSVITGKDSGGSYQNLNISDEGALYVTSYPYQWDYLEVTYPTTTTEVYTFKDGGSGGTTTGTITLTYTDTTKENLSTAEKS